LKATLDLLYPVPTSVCKPTADLLMLIDSCRAMECLPPPTWQYVLQC